MYNQLLRGAVDDLRAGGAWLRRRVTSTPVGTEDEGRPKRPFTSVSAGFWRMMFGLPANQTRLAAIEDADGQDAAASEAAEGPLAEWYDRMMGGDHDRFTLMAEYSEALERERDAERPSRQLFRSRADRGADDSDEDVTNSEGPQGPRAAGSESSRSSRASSGSSP